MFAKPKVSDEGLVATNAIQITCTDVMFILAVVDVDKVFFISISFFGVLVLKFLAVL